MNKESATRFLAARFSIPAVPEEQLAETQISTSAGRGARASATCWITASKVQAVPINGRRRQRRRLQRRRLQRPRQPRPWNPRQPTREGPSIRRRLRLSHYQQERKDWSCCRCWPMRCSKSPDRWRWVRQPSRLLTASSEESVRWWCFRNLGWSWRCPRPTSNLPNPRSARRRQLRMQTPLQNLLFSILS